MNKDTDGKFVKNVFEIYERLDLYKRIIVGATVANVLLVCCLCFSYFGDPIVIMESEGTVWSFAGERREVDVTQAEIKKITEDFIQRRYTWGSFSSYEVIDRLTPILTSGLREKIFQEIEKEAPSCKTLSQYVANVRVTIDQEGNVIGSFDKIVRITSRPKDGTGLPQNLDGIPLLSESQVLVKVVSGTRTKENPLVDFPKINGHFS